MSPRTSPVLLLCGLLCAAGGFDGPRIHAESSWAAKTAWEHVGPGLAGVMAPVLAFGAIARWSPLWDTSLPHIESKAAEHVLLLEQERREL